MSTTTKPWYMSRTIIGVLVSLLAKALAMWGYEVSPALEGEITTLVLTAIGLAGDALAIFGRVKATKGIRRPRMSGGFAAFLLASMVVVTAGSLSACSFTQAETPQQQAYAIEADFQAAQRAVLGYVTSPDADAEVKARLKQLEAAVYGAVVAMREEAAALRRAPPESDAAARRRIALAAAIAAAREAFDALDQYLRNKEIAR